MKKIKVKKKKAVVWRPFERAYLPEMSVEDYMERFGATKEQAEAEKKKMDSQIVWMNNCYQVNIQDMGAFYHVSVKRLDKKEIHDWRNMQRIKNELIGEENEGCELYPAESRRVDTANQYHMFVAKNQEFRFTFGYTERRVEDGTGKHGANQVGGRQRPLEKKSDLDDFRENIRVEVKNPPCKFCGETEKHKSDCKNRHNLLDGKGEKD